MAWWVVLEGTLGGCSGHKGRWGEELLRTASHGEGGTAAGPGRELLAGNPSNCSQRQAENRKLEMSCDSRLPISCSGDPCWGATRAP